ncbi:MAG: carboxypeptidase regulatory-like domain-containing protein [Acidobacteria bacterium]|nr:carboxypeptidase regulatory-like domain-containing protein [Acidobacteriota bacterium]
MLGLIEWEERTRHPVVRATELSGGIAMESSGKRTKVRPALLLLLAVCFPSLAGTEQEKRTVLASLEGVVIDSRTRQPVAGVQVELERGRTSVSPRVRDGEATLGTVTDPRGHFRFNAIEPAVYTLVATKSGYVPTPLHVLELQPDTARRHEVALDPLAKIAGYVVDEAEKVVEGARVAAMVGPMRQSAALRRLLADRGFLTLTTSSDAQGKFELFVPSDVGGVILMAEAIGHAPNRIGPLQVDPGSEGNVVIRLPPGLKGRGRVVDEGGAPLSGATIAADRSAPIDPGLGFGGLPQRATSNDDGSFILRGLDRGTYALRVDHPGHATRRVLDVEIQAGINQIPSIVLARQAEVRGRVTDATGKPLAGALISGFAQEIDIKSEAVSTGDGEFVLCGFPPEASVFLWAEAEFHSQANIAVTAPATDVVLVLDAQGRLRGRVEDFDTGELLREFRIWVAGGPEEKVFRSEDGRFEWRGVPPGRWTFVAQAAGYQKAELRDVEIRPREPADEVVFSLRRGVKLAGRVIDGQTGAALSDVTVTYRDSSEPEKPGWLRFNRDTRITDVDGSFEFDGLQATKVTIIVQSSLYAEVRKTVLVGEADFVEIRLIEKGASISGRVVASDGVTPVPRALIRLEDQTRSIGHGVAADEAGVFSFEGLNAGSFRIVALTRFGQTVPRDIALRENERLSRLILAVTPGVTIRGKVTGILPSEHRVVNINARGRAGFTAFATTDAEGAYAICGVPAGVVQITASTFTFRSVTKSIEIARDAEDVAFDIEFPRAARLTGQVTRAGSPVAHVAVNAAPVDPQLASGSGETGRDGTYTIDGLSDGSYVVGVSAKTPKSVRILGDTILDIELTAHPISGRVVEGSSGEAIAGARIQLQGSASRGGLTAASDTLGHFSLDVLEAGDYKIVVYKSGFQVYGETVSVAGAVPQLTLPLSRAKGIPIRARDGVAGIGLRVVSVYAFSESLELRTDVGLNEDGKGELPQLPPGRYDVIVSAWNYASKLIGGWRVPGTPLDVYLTTGGRLEIYVDSAHVGSRAVLLDASGLPVPVSDRRQGSFVLVHPTVFPHVAPGEHTLSVSLPNGTKAYKTRISEGESTVLRIE